MSGLAVQLTAKALALAVATSPPSVQPRAVADTTTTVEVDASVVGREALAARLRSEVSRLVEVVPLDAGPPMHISVEGELLGFEVRVTHGERSAVHPCPCTHDELVTHVLRRVVAERRVPPRCSPAPSTSVEVSCVSRRPEPSAAELDRTHPTDMPRSRRKASGIALSVVGAATSGAGAGLWLGRVAARGDFSRDTPDVRPYAIAAIASGAVALTVGVVLLLSRSGDRRRRPRARLSLPDRRAADRLSLDLKRVR